MFRLVVIVLTIPGCILFGITGAILGIAAELHWPLSEVNLAYTIRWGVGIGVIGAAVTALALWTAPRERLGWIGSLGAGVTLVVSCASMWWDVVRSLG